MRSTVEKARQLFYRYFYLDCCSSLAPILVDVSSDFQKCEIFFALRADFEAVRI